MTKLAAIPAPSSAAIVALGLALSDPSRLRLLTCLAAAHAGGSEELCVCQVVEVLGLAASTVSRHLSILRTAGLIESRREGRWIYCRLADPSPNSLAAATRRSIDAGLALDPDAKRVAEALRGVLRIHPEDLCCRQRAECSPRRTRTKERVR